MKMLGIKKKVDRLGRICIPKSMRELYGLGDVVELIVTNEGVLLRSANCLEKEMEKEDFYSFTK